ncbi:MAG TPA: hypothetical protein VLH60_01830 [Sedimentisphaerales bacterium]|nr:hypothetical protein [Sedimentisphaerales bacterium]
MAIETRISFVAVALSLLAASASFGAAKAVLAEGSLLAGVDGTLRRGDDGAYIFLPDSPISTARGRLAAVGEIELLPSTTLEHMVLGMADKESAALRLWGTVTLYRGRNFIFPSYYLRLAAPPEIVVVEPDEPVEVPAEPQDNEIIPVINDPNDTIRIPEELMAELRAIRRVIDIASVSVRDEGEAATETSEAVVRVTGDVMVTDRYGILVQTGDSSWAIRFDGLGRNVNPTNFHLLPCEELQTIVQQMRPPAPVQRRYRIAGIVTRFRGEYYMLPTRVTRVFGHGNFTQ